MDKTRKAKRLEKTLKALANRRRLLILDYLRRKRRAIPSDIAQEIKLSFKATSKHLRVLYAAELIDREQFGLRADYFLARPLHKTAKATLEILH